MAEEAAAAWRRTSPPPPPPPTTNQPQPATMAEEAAAAGATPLLEGLPDEIVLWEILVRLDPKSLLRCRAVRRAWRCATSARRFLLAHHARQPSLPIVFGDGYRNILAFDHRASADAQLHTITPLDEDFLLEVSCDGLLVLSKFDYIAGFRTCLSVCNPATRQHASFRPLPGFDILGMYPHSATGEYRLLLQRKNYMESSKEQIGFYVFGFGSDQPPRYIGCSETKLGLAVFNVPVRLRDSLHWYPLEYNTESNNWGYEEESKLVLTVFDTIAESFRQMRAPLGATNSSIFKVDDMLGIYNCNQAMEIVDIWVLQDYESEVWDLKYRVELRLAELIEIRGKLEGCDGDGNWGVVTIASVYVGKMDPHGPGGGPGWGGPTGWGLGGRGPVPPGGPGFPGVPRPGSWGPGFGGFFGSCFYLLCCCCLLQDCCGPLFGHPGPGGPPPPF